MRFHWQNLSRDQKSFNGHPIEGRCWLTVGKISLEFSWHLWTHFCGLSVGRNDDGIKLHAALPPLSFWITVGKRWHRWSRREIDISIHDWALFWTIWRDPMGGWSSNTSRWRQGCWRFLDTAFGKKQYTDVELESRRVMVPMPEGAYPGTATRHTQIWRRPLWFARRLESVWVKMDRGIPHEGKGENSWDCGKDALWGWGSSSHSYEKAIAKGVESVLRSRARHDGDMFVRYPPPDSLAEVGS